MNDHSLKVVGRTRAAPRAPADPERRQAILIAARDSFAQKGFHRTTMRDIARQAGLADGTLYNHFANKDALLLGLFEALGEQTRAGFVSPDGAAPRPTLKAVLAAPLRALAQDNFALLRVVMSEALVRPELGRRFMALLNDQAATGRPDLDIPLTMPTGSTLQALVTGLAIQQALLHEDPAPDPDRVVDELSEQVLALVSALDAHAF